MTDFNWLHYKYLNPDLELNGLISNKDYTLHYKNFGRKEKRNYNIYMKFPDFNYKQYARNYIDLNKYINNKFYLEHHWLKVGIVENRTYFIICKSKLIDDNNNTSLDECDIHYTRTFNMPEIIKCNIITLNKFNKIDNFILIIDFSNLGGGTTFFINTIISKYKNNTTFLIARNYKNKYYFYINDELLLDTQYNEKDSIQFLLNTKDKINKIFINHTLNHSDNFINSLFQLNKHITIITHDMYQITTNPNPYYHRIDSTIRSNIRINKFDMVITQNIKNLNIFNKYLDDKQEIKVVELPDFKYSLNIINTTNIKIVVCFIGNISDIKGSIYIKELYNYYIHNKNIKLILFGSFYITNDSINIEQYKYKNIKELNNLLILHKPNIIIETSIWPETYSYTLTLMMLTQLPIIYFKKSFESVVENRLTYYNKAYPVNNIYEINNILFKIKQNYFYTINTNIYFNSFWNNYFIPLDTNNIEISNPGSLEPIVIIDMNTNNDILIILTTTVNVNINKICIYQKNKNERIATYTKSIIQWLTNTNFNIIVVENSGYKFEELNEYIIKYNNRFEIISFNEKELEESEYLLNNNSKGASEIFAINYAYMNRTIKTQPIFIIKITGRYFIPKLEEFLNKYNLNNYECITQNNRERCEMVGCHNTKFNDIFNINLLDNNNKYEPHIETIWKQRTYKCNKVLICNQFQIETTQRGGANECFNSI